MNCKRVVALTGISVPVVFTIWHHYRPKYSFAKMEASEKKLLESHIKRNDYTLTDVKISSDRFIHTLTINAGTQDPQKPNLVLMHGWSSGLALWAKNIDHLAEHYNVYAVDLLGFGRSARPFFPRATRTTAEAAKSFWVDSFHEWKQEVFGNEKIVLLGHSLGGFLACTYALEQPEDLSKVILVAPIGLAPFKLQPAATFFRKLAVYLTWDVGLTPQDFLRFSSYFSHSLWTKLGRMTQYRGLNEDGWDYLYQLQMGPASGDRAFMNILTKEGWTYPLFDKIQNIRVPMRIIYGETDYVRPSFAPEIMAKVPSADYRVIKGAGHHMYWSHTEDFNIAVINA